MNSIVKERYSSDAEGDDSEDSEDETEDEDGEELTPALDAAILRTLARIKRKDPEIYKSEKSIFKGVYVLDLMESSSHLNIEEQKRTVANKASSRARKDKVLHKSDEYFTIEIYGLLVKTYNYPPSRTRVGFKPKLSYTFSRAPSTRRGAACATHRNDRCLPWRSARRWRC